MIRFIVDSTFCLTKEFAEEHKIKVLSLKLILDGVETDEGFPDNWDEFYNRLKASKNFPTTSQVNAYAYEQTIEEIYSEDENAEIIVLTIAGALSGTINSARLGAQKFADRKLTVIDSHNVTICSKIMLEEMLQSANSGGSFEEVVALSEKLKSKLSVQFIPDTMEYLKRGGRVGKLSAILASIISIKPVFDFRDNKTSVPTKALGIVRGILTMIKRLPAKAKRICLCYIHDDKHIPTLVEKVKILLKIESPEIVSINPVFGVHVGIGTIGLACLEEYNN